MIEFEAPAEDAGARLDVVIAKRAGLSRAAAARAIADGAVTVNGARAGKSTRLEEGARVRADVAAAPADGEAEPPDAAVAAPAHEDIDVRAVYEDDVLMVVSKPAGLVVHPAPGHETGTLVNALVARGARGGDPERPGIVHRLDAGTSGLMIVAKDDAAFEALSEAMGARRISRTYIALVEGRPDTDTLTIDAPIGRSPRHRKKMAVVAGGRDALTNVTVLERHAQTSLVECKPHTGRTHQIRVHLAAAGHPVIGDPIYTRDRRKIASALELERPFLHAARLSFAHPVTAARVDLEDPLPEDLVAALERARGL
jgi:23S rRNA pseudouridine1911/1915/1917 synthase